MPSGLNREAERAVEWDCAQVLTRFFNYFDQWRYDDMAALFAPEGVWHRAGKSLRGQAILDALHARSRTQTVRHIVTNTLVDVQDASHASFVLYITAYMHDSGTEAVKPPVIRSPYLLLVVPGNLVLTADGWKIADMSMNREFEFETPG